MHHLVEATLKRLENARIFLAFLLAQTRNLDLALLLSFSQLLQILGQACLLLRDVVPIDGLVLCEGLKGHCLSLLLHVPGALKVVVDLLDSL